MQKLKTFGHAQMCLRRSSRAHWLFSQHFHEIEIVDAHNGLSGSFILRSQHVRALIRSSDWNRLPIAELDRTYLQHGRGHQHIECQCIGCVRATYFV